MYKSSAVVTGKYVYGVAANGRNPGESIVNVVPALYAQSGRTTLPGGHRVVDEFLAFQAELPAILAAGHMLPEEVTFVDYVTIASGFINARS